MNRWRYRVTIHTAADILALLPEPVAEVPPTIFCDDEGACYFDAGPNPLTQAIERLFGSGWGGGLGTRAGHLPAGPDDLLVEASAQRTLIGGEHAEL